MNSASCRIVLQPSGKEIACAAGDTVLGALEKAGYSLPNNCRAGACGECKVKVLAGEFNQGMVLDMALSPEERRQGLGLMCMAKPLSETLVIQWGSPDARPTLFAPRENQRYVVTDRIMRTPRIIQMNLRPVAAPMRYWPGQYVTLGDAVAGALPRCYSIANAPRPDGEIALFVTRVDGGRTSNWLHSELTLGDVVAVSGPYGTFIGDPAAEVPILCLAAGSGLAPIRCLTEAALRRGYRSPVNIIFSARTVADLFDLGTFKHWETKHRRFSFRPTLTRESAHGFAHGRIPEILPDLFSDLASYGIYIAGTPDFVAACVAAVRLVGARPDMIHTEGFVDQARPENTLAESLDQR